MLRAVAESFTRCSVRSNESWGRLFQKTVTSSQLLRILVGMGSLKSSVDGRLGGIHNANLLVDA